jgi:adenylate kinase family enzyme
MSQTLPIIEKFAEVGKVRKIDSTADVDSVYKSVQEVFKAL